MGAAEMLKIQDFLNFGKADVGRHITSAFILIVLALILVDYVHFVDAWKLFISNFDAFNELATAGVLSPLFFMIIYFTGAFCYEIWKQVFAEYLYLPLQYWAHYIFRGRNSTLGFFREIDSEITIHECEQLYYTARGIFEEANPNSEATKAIAQSRWSLHAFYMAGLYSTISAFIALKDGTLLLPSLLFGFGIAFSIVAISSDSIRQEKEIIGFRRYKAAIAERWKA
jgi:hypothetical protein